MFHTIQISLDTKHGDSAREFSEVVKNAKLQMFIEMCGLQRFIGWAEEARTRYARQGETRKISL